MQSAEGQRLDERHLALLGRHPARGDLDDDGPLLIDPTREAFAAHLGAPPEMVAGWGALGRAIAPQHQRRILPLVARHLAAPEGEAFTQSLRRGEE